MTPSPLDDATRTRLEVADLTSPPFVRADSPAPRGYWRLEESRVIGVGDDVLRAASDLLLSWRVHERAGFTVRTSGTEIKPGTVLTLSTRLGPLPVLAPCRVVRTVREPHRVSFAYGTLPGHPVTGEEEFLLHRDDDGRVVATITAVSRPHSLFARLGAPVTRRQQREIAARYLSALASA